jgi:hypothetical protein
MVLANQEPLPLASGASAGSMRPSRSLALAALAVLLLATGGASAAGRALRSSNETMPASGTALNTTDDLPQTAASVGKAVSTDDQHGLLAMEVTLASECWLHTAGSILLGSFRLQHCSTSAPPTSKITPASSQQCKTSC